MRLAFADGMAQVFCTMKIPASKFPVLATSLAIACLLAGAVAAAENKDDAAAKKAKKEADQIKKYDKNGNGKLDPDEEAAMKADQAKAKAEKEKKKKAAEAK
jgi:hypothetical protein